MPIINMKQYETFLDCYKELLRCLDAHPELTANIDFKRLIADSDKFIMDIKEGLRAGEDVHLSQQIRALRESNKALRHEMERMREPGVP